MTPRATFLNLPRFFRNVKDATVSDPLKIAFHIANVLMVLIPGLYTLPVLNLLGFGARRTISCDAVWVIAFLIWLKVLLKARSIGDGLPPFAFNLSVTYFGGVDL